MHCTSTQDSRFTDKWLHCLTHIGRALTDELKMGSSEEVKKSALFASSLSTHSFQHNRHFLHRYQTDAMNHEPSNHKYRTYKSKQTMHVTKNQTFYKLQVRIQNE